MSLEIDLEKDKGNIFPPFLFLNSACWPFFSRRPGWPNSTAGPRAFSLPSPVTFLGRPSLAGNCRRALLLPSVADRSAPRVSPVLHLRASHACTRSKQQPPQCSTSRRAHVAPLPSLFKCGPEPVTAPLLSPRSRFHVCPCTKKQQPPQQRRVPPSISPRGQPSPCHVRPQLKSR